MAYNNPISMTNEHHGCVSKNETTNGNVAIWNKKGKGIEHKIHKGLFLHKIVKVVKSKGQFKFDHISSLPLRVYQCDVCGEDNKTTSYTRKRCTDCKIEFDRARARRQQNERREELKQKKMADKNYTDREYTCYMCKTVGHWKKQKREFCSKCLPEAKRQKLVPMQY